MAEARTPPKKLSKRWYSQSFKEEWLTDSEFKNWLQEDKNEKGSCYCICCNSKLKHANKSMLLAHQNTEKHKKCFKTASMCTKMDTFVEKSKPSSSENEQIAKAELTIAAFAAEHHLPFAQCDHLIKACKKAFSDSNIAKKITMKATKLSYIIQKGIAYHEKMDISDLCRHSKFSLIIDESTDISTSQILAVVVRVFDNKKLDVFDFLLDTVSVESGTAEGLYQSVKFLLEENNIPITNIIGFGSDNCATMTGAKSGFQALLKRDVPSIFTMGCVCHSFALCASHAVKGLPSYLESFIKNVSSYFSRSSKRLKDFSAIKDVVKSANHKIPKLAQTRWLSRGNVINIILEQWDALLLYFQSESKVDKIDGANNIYETMLNRGTKHMLAFLGYVLEKVNSLNFEFQSEHFRLHLLHSMVSLEYKTILCFYINDVVINSFKLSEIDPQNTLHHKNLDDLYLGGRCMALLVSEPLPEAGVKKFKEDCLKFLVELCLQIQKRFPLEEDSIIAKLRILDPTLAHDFNQSPSLIHNLAMHFPQLVTENNLNKLDDEWRSFRMWKNMTPSYKTIPEYWYMLQNIKDGFNNPKFGMLSNFMTNLTSLPHSSACVERVFSQVNRVKTKSTNSLKVETVKDRLMAKQALSRSNQECHTWEPKKELVKDVMEGVCHRRYEARLQMQKDLQVITLEKGFEAYPNSEEEY